MEKVWLILYMFLIQIFLTFWCSSIKKFHFRREIYEIFNNKLEKEEEREKFLNKRGFFYLIETAKSGSLKMDFWTKNGVRRHRYLITRMTDFVHYRYSRTHVKCNESKIKLYAFCEERCWINSCLLLFLSTKLRRMLSSPFLFRLIYVVAYHIYSILLSLCFCALLHVQSYLV